ncbi:MAG: hypothetical protein AB1641_22265 [Thermodesulfobacteriota bacterium]
MPNKRSLRHLNPDQLETVNQAVAVAEDIISDWFKLTLSSWRKYRYAIKTLKNLEPVEIVPEVFAHILRYGRPAAPDGLRLADFYCICLQDHNIIQALGRDPQLKLRPLLIYVLTHELVHIVRFYKFFQFFDATADERSAEEARVHQLTYQILHSTSLEDMPLILDFYARHRELVD